MKSQILFILLWISLLYEGCSRKIKTLTNDRQLSNKSTDAEKKNGWRALFDGVCSAGWKSADKDGFPKAGWTI